MRRLLAVPIVAFPLACQAVTGSFSVGAGGRDSGVGSNDAGGTDDSATGGADAANDHNVEASADATADGATGSDTGTSEGGNSNDAAEDTSASDAPQDAPAEASACTCVTDMSNIGLADFYIAFTVTLNVTTPVAIANQRSTCTTVDPYWSVHTGSGNGLVYMEIGAGNNVYEEPTNTQSIADGQSHRIVIARTNGGMTFTFTIDGTSENTVNASAEALTGTLAGLEIGVDDACTGNGSVAGQPTNVCITVGCPTQ
jgi:hypothetical protein